MNLNLIEKMKMVGKLIIWVSCCLFLLYLLVQLIKFIHKVWWTPIRVQYEMGMQGIKGPPYKFLHGNNKEIMKMQNEAMMSPICMDLSHHIFPRIQPYIYAWFKLYGTKFLIWIGPEPHLVVTEPELIKEIMNNKDGTFQKKQVHGYLKQLLGDGLATSQGKKWEKQRKLANHAFHGESLKSMIPDMIASAEMMVDRWKHQDGKEMEVFQEFRLMTSEVISRTAFGSSYLEGKNIFDMLLKLSLIHSKNAFTIRLPGISKFLKNSEEVESEKLEKGIRDSVIKMIKKREEKVMSGEVDSFGSDFLGLLVNANHDADENQRITVEDMIDECKTFYIAGQETANALLAWTVFLLAIHTDWQEEARKEVLKLFGQQIPNSDGLTKLKIMTMIINESLRLYPPAVGFSRNVRRKVRLGKLIFPANLNLFIPTLALHHDPCTWGENSHIFKPERFSEGVAKATNNNMAGFVPFGLGPRTCVGLNFATTEAKIALSMILQRYAFTLSPAYVHSPFQILALRPQHGVQIMLHAV